MTLTVRNNLNRENCSNIRCYGRKNSTLNASKSHKRCQEFETFKKAIKKPDIEEDDSTSQPEADRRVQDLPVVPQGVRNIDDTEEGRHNPQLCAEYVPFLYSYLRQLEDKQCIKKDFLKGFAVNSRIRAVLIDWLIDVHNQFRLLQETLYLAIFMLDRYMQFDGANVKKNRYQLVGVTALFTASKVEEMYPPEIRDFVYITDNSFSVQEIRQMERRMLSTLKFEINRPLPLHFLRRYSKAGEVDIVQHTIAKYLIELSQVEYDFGHIKPSELSAAALYLSLFLTSSDCVDPWTVTLQYYSQLSRDQLLPLVHKMAAVLQAAPKSRLKAVFNKYSSKTKLRVSLLPELKGDRIKSLTKTKEKSES
eukprot:TRINITY_DN2311_c0_g1_i1.p1 TRINITY_DN2311_c0_g1~~TRINITY_DN2311_c0_g1_i1.p1  ORF type:complete len:364 (-),score=66.05 TRINITY_DN2311_c0_g1_i1:175-1266(-)